MSTVRDCEVLVEALHGFGACTALYLGPRDSRHLSAARSAVSGLVTLDNDPKLRPDILMDLDGPCNLTMEGELCIASYVLMYLRDPVKVLKKLVDKFGAVLLQENVVRLRGDKDPCRNRFLCPQADTPVRISAIAAAAQEGRVLVDLVNFCFSLAHYYSNGEGCISAVWRLHASGS